MKKITTFPLRMKKEDFDAIRDEAKILDLSINSLIKLKLKRGKLIDV